MMLELKEHVIARLNELGWPTCGPGSAGASTRF